jgi:uncharacterized membrane protein YphA (DoxX/SURF4 family)
MIKLIRTLLNWINRSGQWLGFLGLRMLLCLEFFESGREKFQRENWFSDIHDKFPYPFSLLLLILSGPGKLSLDAWIARRYLGKA